VSCGSVRTKEAFNEGRAVAQRPESLARRSATQKKHVRANQMWTPPGEFAWLDRATYIKDIQPRLINLPISALQSALGISEPYAAFIRAGTRVPHRRHWQTLAHLVGVSQA
jgi:hypothetical protein